MDEIIDKLFKDYSDNISLSEGDYDYLIDKKGFKEAINAFTEWQNLLRLKGENV